MLLVYSYRIKINSPE